ncbi:MAG TPA: hypothetical protein VHS53_00590 [Mucilaginibacter sp.]|nr:hypothetical protein [Mucilaginibacter sp.]
MNFFVGAYVFWKIKIGFFQTEAPWHKLGQVQNATLLDADMHFFIDNATSLPQYLVCKHLTIQFVGLQKVRLGSKQLNLLKEDIQLMATKKKAAKKKKKK